MKNNISLIHIFPLFSALVFTSAQGQTNSASVSSNLQPANCAQFYLFFSKTTFTNGEPISGVGVLTNLTDSPMDVPLAHLNIGFGLTVTDSNGLPLTQINAAHGYHISGPMAVSLPAHDCVTASFELSKLYNFKPGTYKVRAQRQMAFGPPWEGNILTSPVIGIIIEDTNPPAK